MLTTMMLRRFDQSVKTHEAKGESFEYMRHIGRLVPSAFFKFLAFLPLSGHRKHASVEMLSVARVAATAAEDCGPCVQTCVRMALEQGVSRQILRPVVEGHDDDLPADLALVARYARVVAGGHGDAGELAGQLAERVGEAARLELALSIATAKVFPTIKRGLGMARSCALQPLEL